ncbi:hypothetical protein cypCar_00047178, partial [Cyprinus carpio]
VINVTGISVGSGLASACNTLISQAAFVYQLQGRYLQNQLFIVEIISEAELETQSVVYQLASIAFMGNSAQSMVMVMYSFFHIFDAIAALIRAGVQDPQTKDESYAMENKGCTEEVPQESQNNEEGQTDANTDLEGLDEVEGGLTVADTKVTVGAVLTTKCRGLAVFFMLLILAGG